MTVTIKVKNDCNNECNEFLIKNNNPPKNNKNKNPPNENKNITKCVNITEK